MNFMILFAIFSVILGVFAFGLVGLLDRWHGSKCDLGCKICDPSGHGSALLKRARRR